MEKQDPQMMKAAQMSAKQAKEGDAPKKSGWLPRAGRKVKNTVTHPLESTKGAGSWMKKKFWDGEEGTQGANKGKEAEQHATETLNSDLGTSESGQTSAQGPKEEFVSGEDGTAYNIFISAFIDAIERGHARTSDDETANYIWNYVTSDEDFIKTIYEDRILTPAEMYNKAYSDQMIVVRKNLEKKLATGNIGELSFNEVDILITSMLNDPNPESLGRDFFCEFMLNIAKSTKDKGEVGAFLGSTISRLLTISSTSGEVQGRMGDIKPRPPSIMSPEFAQQYFEEKSYGIIDRIVKEFSDSLPEDMHPLKAFGYVAAFRQTLLSDISVIEDPKKFGNKMPTEYKKEISPILEEIGSLIEEMKIFSGSILKKDKIIEKHEKLREKVAGMAGVEDDTKRLLSESLDKISSVFNEKIELMESKEYEDLYKKLINAEEKDKEKAVHAMRFMEMKKGNLDLDLAALADEVGTVPAKEDQIVKKAKEMIEKLKETPTEDGVTEDQYVIAAIIYEKGMKNFETLGERRDVAEVKTPNKYIEMIASWFAGKNITDPEVEKAGEAKEFTAVQKIGFGIAWLYHTVDRFLKKPWISKKWANRNKAWIPRLGRNIAYYSAKTARILLNVPMSLVRIGKYWIWDSNQEGKIYKAVFGFGLARKIYEHMSAPGEWEKIQTIRGEAEARRGFLGSLWLVGGTIAFTTVVSIASAWPLGDVPLIGKKNKLLKTWRGQMSRTFLRLQVPVAEWEWAYPTVKRGNVVWRIHNQERTNTVRHKITKSVAEDAVSNKKYMLNLYYPGIKRENFDAKEKEYTEQLEWIENNPDVARFLAERTFLNRIGRENRVAEKREGTKGIYNELGWTHTSTEPGANEKYHFETLSFSGGEIKDGLKVNVNMTPEFIGKLMAREKAGKFVSEVVNEKLKTLAGENETYQDVVKKHGEDKVLEAIDGHLMSKIELAILGDKNAKSELKDYGITLNDEGELLLNGSRNSWMLFFKDAEKLKSGVMENVVNKIEKYGIKYFDEQVKLAKIEVDYSYLEGNLKRWTDQGYLVTKSMQAYMNTYGVKSPDTAELLIANPDIGEWLGPKTVRGHAPIYIRKEGIEKVVEMINDEIEKEVGKDKVGIIAVIPQDKKMEIFEKVLKKAEEEKIEVDGEEKPIIVDTKEEYARYLALNQLKEDLGRYYPEREELIDYLLENEVKQEWFDYLLGKEIERDKQTVRKEIIDYFVNQKDYLVSIRAERIDEDIKEVKEKTIKLGEAVEAAETPEEKEELNAEIDRLKEVMSSLEEEKKNPGKYVDAIIAYLKGETKVGVEDTGVARELTEAEKKKGNRKVLEYLENARKEKDIKHLLMGYKSKNSTMSILPNMLEPFIVEVMEHIEKGGRADHFNAKDGKLLTYAKDMGYLWPLMTEVKSIMGGKLEFKTEAEDKSHKIIVNLDSVIKELKDKEEYQKSIERHGENLVKNEIKGFIYQKMSEALESNEAMNELAANGVKFDKEMNASIDDSKKLAEYIYENKIKGLAIAVNISDDIRGDSADVLNVVEGMMAGMTKKKGPYKQMIQEHGEEHVNEVIEAYLLKQIYLAKSGETAVADMLNRNGIGFDAEGKPELNENADKLSAFISKMVLQKMKNQGIEYFDDYMNETQPEQIQVVPGEPAGEGIMTTPVETNEQKYGKEIVLDGLINSGDFTIYKNKQGNMTAVFNNDNVYHIGTFRPGDAVKEIENKKDYKDVSRDVKLIEKDGQAVYEVEATYTKGINKDYRVHYYIIGGKIDNAEEI